MDLQSQQVRIVGPKGGNIYQAGANELNIMIGAKDTGGAFELIEEVCQPGFMSRMHLHNDRSQTFYIVEGSASVIVGEEHFDASQGSCVHVPPGVPHQIESEDGVKMIMVFSPGGMENLFSAVQDLSPEQAKDPEITSALTAAHDTIMVDDESKGTVLG
jgi:mannose-6-phosphate isomerase-like protein (cupin superfamily)